ncbi:MAG: SoxR reducing system RseC family protein [Elusimicrobiota bacterium]
MEEIATVVDISGDKLKLSFTRQLLCHKCGVCQKSSDGQMYLEVENTIGAEVGDKVLLKIEPSNLKISAILYGIPSAMFIVGIFGGYFLSEDSEIFGFFTGVLFLIFSIPSVRIFAKKHKLEIEKIK